MFCRVKVNGTGLNLYRHDGTNISIDGKEFDSYKFSNNQVIILDPGGSVWVDKHQVEDVEDENKSNEEKISGLRNLIGQDMKQIAIEFK
jgi:hypothetical protein